MSKLSEYSKFDHLIDDDDDDDTAAVLNNNNNAVVADTNDQHLSPSSSAAAATTTTTNTSNFPSEPSSSSSTLHDENIMNMMRHVRKPKTTTTTTSSNLRFMVQYQGNTIYEWEQSLNEVIIYIISPLQQQQQQQQPSTTTNTKIFCHISATHLQVGITKSVTQDEQHHHLYIDEDIYHPIDTKESTWCIEEEEEEVEERDSNHNSNSDHRNKKQQHTTRNVITIYLQKVAKGLVWEAVLRGHHTNHDTTTTTTLDPISLQEVQKSLLLERWQEENPGMDFRDATFNNNSGSIPDPRTYMGGIGYE